jgi:hypothetical protein
MWWRTSDLSMVLFQFSSSEPVVYFTVSKTILLEVL